MLNDKILILGASDNPNRTSYSAIKLLFNRGFNLYAHGDKKGRIENIPLHDDSEKINKADTITIFLNAKKQRRYYDYILSVKPKRIIFNPGTENPELEFLAQKNHIQVIKSCTIALLANQLW